MYMQVRLFVFIMMLLFAVSCTTIRLAVPAQFRAEATQLPVKGLQGFSGKKPVEFGTYHTSRIRRGWNTTSFKKGFAGASAEALLLTAFAIPNDRLYSNQRTKYQYFIQDGRLGAEVFCQEQLQKEVLDVQTGVDWLGDFSRTEQSLYTFSALLLPYGPQEDKPWVLRFSTHYDRQKDTARKILDMPYLEETGWATNGKDTITVRSLRVNHVTTKKGTEAKLPFKIPTGYELRLDEGLIAIVDAFGKNVWLYNGLDAPTKLIAAALSSALLLRNVKEAGR